MLSWDEYDADQPVEQQAAPANAADPEPVMQMAEPEPAPIAEPAPQTSAETTQPEVEAVAVVQEATPAQSTLDTLPTQLEGEEYQRVNVDQKRMINCRADLNQLVPFKYD